MRREEMVAEVFPPGEFISEELEARGWSQLDLAEIIGRTPAVVNEIIKGKRMITPETAKELSEAFGTSAQLWMNLESSYRLWRAQDVDSAIERRSWLYQLAPVKEMVKRYWIAHTENLDVLEQEIANFFEIKSIKDKISCCAAARKSGSEEFTSAQLAWMFRVKHLARHIEAKPYTVSSFESCVDNLKGVINDIDQINYIPKILADAGIRLVLLEHLPKTKIDGVTLWLNAKSPVIALSIRYDRIDSFWYTLFHELGHVKNKDGLKTPVRLDLELVGSKKDDDKPAIEKKADRFAYETLVPRTELNAFIKKNRPRYSAKSILGFAHDIGVHPGIVVGQLQFRGEVPWSSFRNTLEKVRHLVIDSAMSDGWGASPELLG